MPVLSHLHYLFNVNTCYVYKDSGKDSGQKLMDLCMRGKSEQF
jgi:hypothetical protein